MNFEWPQNEIVRHSKDSRFHSLCEEPSSNPPGKRSTDRPWCRLWIPSLRLYCRPSSRPKILRIVLSRIPDDISVSDRYQDQRSPRPFRPFQRTISINPLPLFYDNPLKMLEVHDWHCNFVGIVRSPHYLRKANVNHQGCEPFQAETININKHKQIEEMHRLWSLY